MRKILCLSCIFCPPIMAHSRIESGDMTLMFFFTVLTIFILLFLSLSKSDLAFNNEHSIIVKALDSLGMFSLGFAPYYLILLIIYGIILAFNRIRKKTQFPLADDDEDFSQKIS